jgi:TonB family protein
MFDRQSGERDNRSHLNGMIILSLVLHAVALTLLFLSPSFPTPKLTFGPIHSVSLVSFSGKMIEKKGSSREEKELLAADRQETILKKRIEPGQVIPIRSLETRKKRDSEIEKALEEIRKKATASSDPVKRPQTSAVPEKTASAASPSGDAGTNAQMNPYYALIWSRIKGLWALPPGILPREDLETVIDVTISRSGAVMEIIFEKRSGNRYFDESAMKAIQKASPFPPLPSSVGDTSIQVGIRFHSSELNS